jgi:hypothetical protein
VHKALSLASLLLQALELQRELTGGRLTHPRLVAVYGKGQDSEGDFASALEVSAAGFVSFFALRTQEHMLKQAKTLLLMRRTCNFRLRRGGAA